MFIGYFSPTVTALPCHLPRQREAKGFGDLSPNINSADCGKQIDRQGQCNWQVAEYLRKSRKNFLASELFVSEGEIPVICSSRSIPHLCCVRGMGRIATPHAFGSFLKKRTIKHQMIFYKCKDSSTRFTRSE